MDKPSFGIIISKLVLDEVPISGNANYGIIMKM
jgi:hypothetical protein